MSLRVDIDECVSKIQKQRKQRKPMIIFEEGNLKFLNTHPMKSLMRQIAGICMLIIGVLISILIVAMLPANFKDLSHFFDESQVYSWWSVTGYTLLLR